MMDKQERSVPRSIIIRWIKMHIYWKQNMEKTKKNKYSIIICYKLTHHAA